MNVQDNARADAERLRVLEKRPVGVNGEFVAEHVVIRAEEVKVEEESSNSQAV